MSAIHSVGDITKILSNIIQNEPTLRDVWVRGEVLIEGPSNTFTLIDEEKKLRCFIRGGNTAQFRSLLVTGKKVTVNGRIALFPRFSEYQIHLVDLQVGEPNLTGNTQLLTVGDVTDRLEEIIANFPRSQQIHVRGEISYFESPLNQPWYLSDPSDGGRVTDRNQKIHCFINSDLINNTVLMKEGGTVRIQGAVRIWGAFSRYQIHVEHIKSNAGSDNSNNTQCQCSGCESCQPQGVSQQCSPLQDPEYELCAKCYHESPDRENRVAQAVYAYLDALGGSGFSPEKEWQIQMGASNRKADVVLVNGDGNCAAIAECKGAGYVGQGIEQLNAYLSASDTPFGIFANRVNPKQWKFYKNQGQNQFESITPDLFKAEIKGLTDCDVISTRNQIDTLVSKNEQLRQTQRGLKEEFDRIKVFLQSATQIVESASEKIDE